MTAMINKLARFSLVLALITAGYGCDVFLPDKGNEGQPCLDNGECKPGLVCQDGKCVEGSTDGGQTCQTDAECDDDNPCTADLCVQGSCTNTNLQNDTPCDDGDGCTTDDACREGECSGTAKDCSHLDGLCKRGDCFPDNGQCVQISADDGDDCDDGLYCTTGDQCLSGECVGTDRDCSDGDVCTADQCNETEDECQNPLDPGAGTTEGPVGDASCDNGVDDDCDGHTDQDDSECVACTDDGDCDDGNACTTDTCAAGQCTYMDKQNGTACDDGQYCTENDACLSGSCTGQARDCSSLSDACNNGACSENQDICVAQPKANGTDCDDGLYCTVPDQCNNGVCQLDARDCDDGNGCTEDECDDVNDQCTNTLVPNPGAEGPAGNGTCQNGLDDDCDGLTDLDDSDCVDCQSDNDCNDSNPCTLDECNSGTCFNPPQVGEPCDDENPCTHTDQCQSDGACRGTTIECPDDDPPCGVVRTCNGTDQCDEEFPDASVTCDDAEPCTYDDRCDGSGGCTGSTISCENGTPPCGVLRTCNGTDQCDEEFPGVETSCDDSEFCTYNDACNGAGACVGTEITCQDDPGPCGVQRECDGTDTCKKTYPDETVSCEDGQYCTDGDHCDGNGVCAPGTDTTCDTGWTCWEDEDRCCQDGVSVVCGASDNDLHREDSCGHEGDVVEDCPDPNGECVNGGCQCRNHWIGQDCTICEQGWTGADCDVCLRYVHKTVLNPGDGKSWTNAFPGIQAALDAARQEIQLGNADRCEVWVAADTFHIYQSSNADTVRLQSGVELYGGFTTSMSDRSQRNWYTHLTVLSGWNPVHHLQVTNVVTGADNAVIDGFLITGGNAIGAPGAGMLNDSVSPHVENCVFLENRGEDGAGMANYNCSPTVKNCHFTRNDANSGGAMYNSNSSELVEGCIFAGNSAAYGGGIYSHGGGGHVNNSMLVGNSVTQNAASFMVADETVANCTFYGNGPGTEYNSIGVSGSPKFRNSILWDTAAGNQTLHLSGADVQYSDVHVGTGSVYPGTGNIKSDPNFTVVEDGLTWTSVTYSESTYQTKLNVAPRNWDLSELKGMALRPSAQPFPWYIILENGVDSIYVWGDLSNDIQVGMTLAIVDLSPPDRSPVIDIGDACSAPAADMRSNSRIDDTDIPNDGVGPPWVDMGALEWQDGNVSHPTDLLSLCCGIAYSHDGHTYHVCPGQFAWGTAVFRCALYGSYLVTIGDSSENTFVNGIATTSIWIGANDIKKESFWEWITAENWTFETWDTGQPDNVDNEDCVEMKSTARWQDISCRFNRHFVCEKPN